MKKDGSSLNRKAQITPQYLFHIRSVITLPEAEDDSRIGGTGSSHGGMGVALSANITGSTQLIEGEACRVLLNLRLGGFFFKEGCREGTQVMF